MLPSIQQGAPQLVAAACFLFLELLLNVLLKSPTLMFTDSDPLKLLQQPFAV